MQKHKRTIRVYTSRANLNNPCIILQGKWLARLGFSAGDYLSITEANQIIIQIKKKFNQEKQ